MYLRDILYSQSKYTYNLIYALHRYIKYINVYNIICYLTRVINFAVLRVLQKIKMFTEINLKVIIKNMKVVYKIRRILIRYKKKRKKKKVNILRVIIYYIYHEMQEIST